MFASAAANKQVHHTAFALFFCRKNANLKVPTLYPGDQQCLPEQQQLRLTFSLRHMCVRRRKKYAAGGQQEKQTQIQIQV